jgi:hypothetical protein
MTVAIFSHAQNKHFGTTLFKFRLKVAIVVDHAVTESFPALITKR